MTSKRWNCLVVDAGARYGIHPSWRDAMEICEFHLFEPEPHEAKRLQGRYRNSPNISVYAKALASQTGARNLVIRRHKGLSGLDTYELDNSVAHVDFQSGSLELSRVAVDAVQVDNFFYEKRVDFLKLDTEGSDLEILQGAEKQLEKSVLGIRVNVNFLPLHKTGATFSEIDIHLTQRDFILNTLEIDSRVARRQGVFPLSTSSGSLLGGDAIWMRDPEDILARNSQELNVLFALFLYLNNLGDVALQFLVKSTAQNRLDLQSVSDQLFVSLLETKILSHLSSALAAGWWDSTEITSTYSNLFFKDFPTKEDLYLRLFP